MRTEELRQPLTSGCAGRCTADTAGGLAGDNGAGRDILRDNGPGGDYGIIANADLDFGHLRDGRAVG